MKMKIFCALLTVGFTAIVACSMAAQETPQPVQAAIRTKQPAKRPAKNAHKVWSNDDFESSHASTSKDPASSKETATSAQPTATSSVPAITVNKDSETKKAATPAQPAATGDVSTAPAPQAPPSIKLPETVELTKQAIYEETQDTRDVRESLSQVKEKLYASTDGPKPGMQSQIDRYNKVIDANEADLKILQDHLQKLLAKQAAGNSTSPK
jgi:hypothetical protein